MIVDVGVVTEIKKPNIIVLDNQKMAKSLPTSIKKEEHDGSAIKEIVHTIVKTR
jgi:hypothetical protein